MSKGYYERRLVRLGDFEYLVDDEDRTCWIYSGHSGGARIYHVPDSVIINQHIYSITGIGLRGYITDKDRFIEELFLPDSCLFFDELSFIKAPVKKLHIGKGLLYYDPWSLKNAASDLSLEIHPDNPELKMSDDGHFVLSKDGKRLFALIHDIEEASVPAGVETICRLSVSCKKNLRILHLPQSFNEIEDEALLDTF